MLVDLAPHAAAREANAVFYWNYLLRNRYWLMAYLAAACGLVLLGTLPVTLKSAHGHQVYWPTLGKREVGQGGISRIGERSSIPEGRRALPVHPADV